MPAPRPWTDADDARLVDLHAADTSTRAMGTQLGRTRSSVDRRLRHLGLGATTRLGTMAATAANMTDAKARRSVLELELLTDAERLRLQMFAPTVAFNFGGKDNTYAEKALTQPTFADQLKIMQAATIAVAHSLKIADHDVDAGLADTVGMLDVVFAGIVAAAADQAAP